MAQVSDSELTGRIDRRAVKRSVFSYIMVLELVQIGIAFLLAWRPGPPRLGIFYGVCALPWALLVGYVISRNIHLLYTEQGRMVNKLNLATRVTLIRVLCIPLVLSLIFEGHHQLAAIVFVGAALTDWLDGFLARRMGDVTQLGRVADPSIDALFCGFTLLTLARVGELPFWVLLLVSIRYLLLTGGMITLRVIFGFMPVRATFLGRLFYFFQYCLLVAILLFPDWPQRFWLIRGIGVIQAAVIAQLLLLGFSIYEESKHA